MFVKSLATILGVLPLLWLDIAVILSASQAASQRENSAEALCRELTVPGVTWQSALEARFESGHWNDILQMVATCTLNDDAAAFDDLLQALFTPLQSRADAAVGTNADAVAVARLNMQQQIVALQGLEVLFERALQSPHAEVRLIASKQLAPALRQLIPLVATKSAVDEMSTVPLVATNVTGRLGQWALVTELEVAVLNGSELARAQYDSAELIEPLQTIATATDATYMRRLGAFNALRDLGYTFQQQFPEAFSKDDEETDSAITTDDEESPMLVMTLRTEQIALISAGMKSQLSAIQQAPSSQDIALRVAQVEALAAFWLPETEEDVDDGLFDLTCITADANYPACRPNDDLHSGEVAYDEAIQVRAAALRELERLGGMPNFSPIVQAQLRAIALADTHDAAIRIGALETLSRLENQLVTTSTPIVDQTPDFFADRAFQADLEAAADTDEPAEPPFYERIINDEFALLNLLTTTLVGDAKEGQIDERSRELQERAESAFEQRYQGDLNKLSYAVEKLYTSDYEDIDDDNATVQRTIVQALGGVNYYRLLTAGDAHVEQAVKRLTGFLGQSLLCSPDEDIRQASAYALSRIAPHWPEMLETPFIEPLAGNDTRAEERYWYTLLPERADLPAPTDDLCSSMPAPSRNREDLSTYREETLPANWRDLTVLDALILSLNDQDFDVVAVSASTLSRYGIASDRQFRLAPGNTDSAGNEPRKSAAVEQLGICMKALMSPTRLTNWGQKGRSPDDMPEHFQSFIALADEYAKTCGYLLPAAGTSDWGGNEQAAIAAAYVLGQIGITDGIPFADGQISNITLPDGYLYDVDRQQQSDLYGVDRQQQSYLEHCPPNQKADELTAEQQHIAQSCQEHETIAYSLWVLQARDWIAQYELSQPTSPRPPLNMPARTDHDYWNDDVRDSIASYVFGEIHPREYELIQLLVAASTYSERHAADSVRIEHGNLAFITCPLRQLEEQPVSTNKLVELCMLAPVTRTAILSAVEFIGIEEEVRDFFGNELDHRESEWLADYREVSPELESLRMATRQQQIGHYVGHRLRRLMVQDRDPELSQLAIANVIAQATEIAETRYDRETERMEMPSESDLARFDSEDVDGEQFLPLPPVKVEDSRRAQPSASRESPRQPANLQAIEAQLQAHLGEARYILAFPFVSIYACTGAANALTELGVYDNYTVDQLFKYIYNYPEPWAADTTPSNLCIPDEDTETSDGEELPSRFEQIVQLKTGAIAALGEAQRPELTDKDDVAVHRYRNQGEPGDIDLIEPQKLQEVVTQLIEIANFGPLYDKIVPLTNAQKQDIAEQLNVDDAAVEQALALGLNFRQLKEETTAWGLTPRQRAWFNLTEADKNIAEDLNLTMAEWGQAKQIGITQAEIEAAQNEGFSVQDVISTHLFELTYPEIKAARDNERVIHLLIRDKHGVRLRRAGFTQAIELGLSLADIKAIQGWDPLPHDVSLERKMLLYAAGQQAGLTDTDILAIEQLTSTSTTDKTSGNDEFSDLEAKDIAMMARLAAAKRLSVTDDDIEAGRRFGLSPEEVAQAHKWDLEYREFIMLKRRMQAAAIAALGRLTLNEGPESYDALCALAFNNLPASPDNTTTTIAEQCGSGDAPVTPNQDFRSLSAEQIRTLKLEQLHRSVLGLQEQYNNSGDRRYRNKIDFVLSHYLLPHLRQLKDPDSDTEPYANIQLRSERIRIARQVGAEFQDEVFDLLISLDTELIGALAPSTRQSIYDMLGISSTVDNTLAQECLDGDLVDLFTQERVCYGVARLVGAIWSAGNTANLTDAQIEEALAFLRALTQDPDDDSTNVVATASTHSIPVNNNIGPLPINRTNAADAKHGDTPFIRSSGVEALSAIEAVGGDVPNFSELLFARLMANDEPGVIENVVIAYAQSNPDQEMRFLQDKLRYGNEREQYHAAWLIARLGQTVQAIEDTEENDIAIDINIHPSWSAALTDEQMLGTLFSVLQNESLSVDQQVDFLNALGETRTDNDAVIALLVEKLDPDEPWEVREAAAYALGKIGEEHPALGKAVARDLYDMLAVSVSQLEDSQPEVRLAAAYALSEISNEADIYNFFVREPEPLTRHAVAHQLIELFECFSGTHEIRITPGPEVELCEPIEDPARSAIALKALGQVGIRSEQISAAFAKGLDPEQPIEVRAIAATYAKDVRLFDATLAEAMLDALDDPHWTVRYRLILGLEEAESLNEALASIGGEYLARFEDELFNLFGNEQEDVRVRLVAGNAIVSLGFVPAETLESENVEFRDTWLALQQDSQLLSFNLDSSNYLNSRLDTSITLILVLDNDRGDWFRIRRISRNIRRIITGN